MAGFNMFQKVKRFGAFKRQLPAIVGQVGVTHFVENWRKQGFDDNGIEKWKDVKRRDPNSPWYGYSGRTRKRSSAATKRAVLVQTGALRDSVRVVRSSQEVVSFGTNQAVKNYAAIHNEGGNVKVFGKASAQMPKRKFMGKSRNLNKKIVKNIKVGITKLFK